MPKSLARYLQRYQIYDTETTEEIVRILPQSTKTLQIIRVKWTRYSLNGGSLVFTVEVSLKVSCSFQRPRFFVKKALFVANSLVL